MNSLKLGTILKMVRPGPEHVENGMSEGALVCVLGIKYSRQLDAVILLPEAPIAEAQLGDVSYLWVTPADRPLDRWTRPVGCFPFRVLAPSQDPEFQQHQIYAPSSLPIPEKSYVCG